MTASDLTGIRLRLLSQLTGRGAPARFARDGDRTRLRPKSLGSSSITPPAPFCLSGRYPLPALPAPAPATPAAALPVTARRLSCCMEPSPRAGASGRQGSGGMTALAGWWWRCTTALKCG